VVGQPPLSGTRASRRTILPRRRDAKGLPQGGGEYHHEYRASDTPGTWVCLRCGQTLGSEPIVVPKDDPKQT